MDSYSSSVRTVSIPQRMKYDDILEWSMIRFAV
jgi:hypothetical protein